MGNNQRRARAASASRRHESPAKKAQAPPRWQGRNHRRNEEDVGGEEGGCEESEVSTAEDRSAGQEGGSGLESASPGCRLPIPGSHRPVGQTNPQVPALDSEV